MYPHDGTHDAVVLLLHSIDLAELLGTDLSDTAGRISSPWAPLALHPIRKAFAHSPADGAAAGTLTDRDARMSGGENGRPFKAVVRVLFLNATTGLYCLTSCGDGILIQFAIFFLGHKLFHDVADR